MDARFHGFLNPSTELQQGSQSSMAEFPNRRIGYGPFSGIAHPDQGLVNGQTNQISSFQQHYIGGVNDNLLPNQPFSNGSVSSSPVDIEEYYHDECDFSDAILRYIDKMLMEEDMEEKIHILQESLDLQAKEKSFYEMAVWFSGESLHIRDMYSESQSVWNFKKGVKEASKFLPSEYKLSVNVDVNGLLGQDAEGASGGGAERSPSEFRGRKSGHVVERDLEEERSNKLPATYLESNLPIEEFDNLLLHSMGEGEKKFAAYRADLKNAMSKGVQQTEQIKGSNGRRGNGKKHKRKKEVIDLRTLLISCAQAVAADDPRSAGELLKQIRQHSSPFGDGNQRMAHYFADGLEARLAGTGSQIHKALVNKRTTTDEYLRAHYTFIASSPFRKISNFATNKTIITKAQKATRIHIIDFGIHYGFQWPTFIQRIAGREGGPPKLRITGIDFPQPGFRPAERIEDTGRRLAHYAKAFNMSFEYRAIAQKWETIKIEDLKIEEDEFVAVTCLYRTKNLLDETVMAENSARTTVLNLIRKINPAIFIHGIVNGAYSAPFFVTRFREVLFHFSALFDMLETNVPREKSERVLIERDIFGKDALNVIACEGWERVERPETYKQWQVRNMRAGFSQVPFDREVMSMSRHKVKTFYHKDFVIDEDSQWLLLGWKGRIIYAMSCWKPV
ncbi:UNVERIFIED_CONTAM: Scarecrow-like protein 9 [Sesamum angustifolium]|uniref:Scarecrow-like protein 9 n=1 Tax=Sesamum angustifolium TaxID=2727405 RepID=A0AAW2N5U8_9LAMI